MNYVSLTLSEILHLYQKKKNTQKEKIYTLTSALTDLK